MAERKSDEFYSSIEKHLVRILLIVLLIFAEYKLVMIEFPHGQPLTPTALPCGNDMKTPPTVKKKKRRKQRKISTLPTCTHRRK